MIPPENAPPSCARPGSFDFAQGRLRRAPLHTWFLLIILSSLPLYAQSSRPASPKTTAPDPGELSGSVYRNASFGFTYKMPYGWVDRTAEMREAAMEITLAEIRAQRDGADTAPSWMDGKPVIDLDGPTIGTGDPLKDRLARRAAERAKVNGPAEPRLYECVRCGVPVVEHAGDTCPPCRSDASDANDRPSGDAQW